MCNFAEDIEKVAREEEILAVVLAHERNDSIWSESKEPHPVLTWKEARPLLDYDYDDGYGGADCHAIFAWTPTRIIVIAEYDGSTSVISLPRDPISTRPRMV